MSSGNEVERLILEVGAELGRSPDQMEPIVRKIVREEWFDTIDSLRSLTEEQWTRLGIPARVAEKLKSRILVESTTAKEWKVEAAPPLEQAVDIPISLLLESLAVEAGNDVYPQSIKTLLTVVKNILSDPSNPKFRQLKRSNPSLSKLVFQFPSAVKLIEILGFFPSLHDEGVLACNTAYLSRLTDVQRQLDPLSSNCFSGSGESFNPFKASIVNAGDTFGVPKGQILAEREAEMEKIRKETALLKSKSESTKLDLDPPRLISLGEKSRGTQKSDSVDHEVDNSLLLSNMRSLVAAGENAQKFRSRERLELEKLKTRQSFPTTKVRILFADQKALELNLSSSESIRGVYAALMSCLKSDLQNDWELTVSPPLRRLARDSLKTLLEEDFVPSVSLRMVLKSNLCSSFDVLAPKYIL